MVYIGQRETARLAQVESLLATNPPQEAPAPTSRFARVPPISGEEDVICLRVPDFVQVDEGNTRDFLGYVS